MKSFTRNHGAALVITLAMIAMLTFLIVAFLSRSVANLQIESASTGTARADVLAKSAGGIIVSDFKSEIIAGSSASGTAAQAPVYLPTKALAAVPAVSIHPFITGEDLLPFANLVKQSTGRFYPDADPYNSNVKPIIQTVTNVTTDIPSQNGRAVINKRWDNASNISVPSGPLLLLAGKGQSPTDTPSDSRFSVPSMLPHWIMMTRQGVPATQTWTTDWANYAPTNSNAVIGRFAYNIYNTGGLLDANVTGYDETLANATSFVTTLGQKGTVGLAKLSLIPGMGSIPTDGAAKFTKSWRNLATANTSDNYLAYLGFSKNGTSDLTGNQFFMAGPKVGFLKAVAGTTAADNRVLGRQDLIRLAIKTPTSPNAPSPYGLTISSLPYLTHFSREVNAPSWSPTYNAVDVGGNNGTAVGAGPVPYAYLTNKDNVAVANRFLPNVRVAPGSTWLRLTGERAVDGEPLIKYRFPLSWLAILQDRDPTTADWDLTPEAVSLVTALNLRNIANGGVGLGGTTTNEKAAWLVSRAFGLAWNKAEYRWDYTGSPSSPTATLSTVVSNIEVLGDSTSALTVSKETREPNFFELLKSGMLSGSLGNSSDFESMCASVGADSNPDYQVIQIGANIIDQADTDSYPTRIAFGSEMDSPPSLIAPRSSTNLPLPFAPPVAPSEVKVFAGVEDVPFIYTFLSTPYRIPAGEPNVNPATDPNSAVQDGLRDTIDGFLQFVLWKPQQQATSTAAPSKFRILFTGGPTADIHLTYFGPSPAVGGGVPIEFPVGSGVKYLPRDTVPHLPDQAYVLFTDTAGDFRAPTLLGGMDLNSVHGFSSSQPQGNGVNPSGHTQLPRGMWLGETFRPEQRSDPASPNYTAPAYAHTEFRCYPDSRFDLQYQDGTGSWRTYQRYNRFGVATGQYFRGRGLYGFADSPYPLQQEGSPVFPASGPPVFGALDVATLAMGAVDPRTQRFGLMALYLDSTAPSWTTPAMLPPSGTAYPNNWKYFLKQGWSPKTSTPYWVGLGPTSGNGRFTPSWNVGTHQNPWQDRASGNPIVDPTKFWVDNATSTVTTNSYKDMDLIQRRGDGDSADSVRLLQLVNSATVNTQNFGRVLNRAFRSVGELSYVFRDEPYKSLNLFTPSSGDGALLDLFSVNEQAAVVAGKVNLNSQNPEALAAVIVGAAREELSTTNTISAADALFYANNLINGLTIGAVKYPGTNTVPLLNPSEIANRLFTMVPTSSTPDQAIKTRRDVVARALAGSGQTRTWNLLLDVIAQSGRYASSASSASQFIVEGEKRYWMHLAIDRYTGQVVDQQLEPVME